jgi:putative addiction module CopG family antidote
VPERDVNLPEHFADFVDASLASGRFQSTSEAVIEALRLFETRQRDDAIKLQVLRRAIRRPAISTILCSPTTTPCYVTSSIGQSHGRRTIRRRPPLADSVADSPWRSREGRVAV